MAEVLTLIGMAKPAVVEAYNVDKTTRHLLSAGSNGPGRFWVTSWRTRQGLSGVLLFVGR